MTTATLTLSEFLLARIEEDEAVASRAVDFPFSVRGTPWGAVYEVVPDDPANSRTQHHLAVDPARVLAECGAKRRIMEGHVEAGCDYCPEVVDDCPTLRALAAVYSDHADFQEAWRV